LDSSDFSQLCTLDFNQKLQKKKSVSNGNEPPPTKVEGFSGLERLRRTVGFFPTEVGGFKPDFGK
jgi:hypothetical protein